MPSLKEYRDRIASVKSTKKITSAMKMVAASKLKKAQDQAEASQPYARAMGEMLARVAAGVTVTAASPKLLIGTGSDKRHLLVVVTSDRGLCGGFNGNLVRLARNEIIRLQGEGKEVQVVTVGRKARDLLKREFSSLIIESYTGIGSSNRVQFSEADQVTQFVLEQFEAGNFDVCSLVYNNFVSVLTQQPRAQQIIPFKLPETGANDNEDEAAEGLASPYRFEPEEEAILAQLLPRNLGVQMFRALLDSAAGEQAARMTAMDNATRNAGDRINGLTLEYNRARQAAITKELIEIISGAEAL
ncbi:MAG: F0F1 ATP synthase subunit gamma [Alphaproteobacteria bacterium]|nr:F0F1 ATP synthase subunit gamma [Alphaproteobacteria bacterium]